MKQKRQVNPISYATLCFHSCLVHLGFVSLEENKVDDADN